MCSLCSALTSDHWADAGEAGGRRSRVLRTRAVATVLGHYGLDVREWAGAGHVVGNRKGRSELVADLGALWQEAQRMAATPIDPLDPALIERLET